MTPLSRASIRCLLRLFPRGFRDRYGTEMLEAFEDRWREASAHGRRALLRLWLRTLSDLLRSALRERWDRPSANLTQSPRQWGAGLGRDLASAWRFGVRHPASSAAILLLVALGTGACTAMFGLFSAVLLRPLPYPEADRLVEMWETFQESQSRSVSYPNFQDWAAQNSVFESMGASVRLTFVLWGKEQAQQLGGAGVTPGVFEALKLEPLLGRPLTAEDMELSAAPAAVISQGLWQGLYASDPAILGREIVLDGKARRIVGVMPAAFRYPNQFRTEVWVPLPAEIPMDLAERGSRPGTIVLAKLKPDQRLEQARAEMQRIMAQLSQAYPEANREGGAGMQLLKDRYVSDYRPPLRILLAGVGFLLLVACANLANLSLARNSERQREFSLRLALGAARWRLVRQVLAESLLLSLAGGALGILLSLLLTQAGRSALSQPLAVLGVEGSLFDWRVAVFALSICLSTGIAFGLAPALFSSRTPARQAMQVRSRAGLSGGARLRSLLVLAEVALSAVLLTGAGLTIRSLAQLQSVDAGFEVENLASLRLNPTGPQYADAAQKREYYRRVMQRLKRVSGVESVAMVHPLPLVGWGSQWGLRLQNSPVAPPDEPIRSDVARVSEDYFRTMGIQVLEGRTFSLSDRRSDRAVIDRTMASKYFPNGALGQTIRIGETTLEVIGVVDHVKNYGVNRDSRIQLYVNAERVALGGMSFVVRTGPEAASLLPLLREAAAEADPLQPSYMLATMQDYYANNIAKERLTAVLLPSFAGFALILAGFGLYGVIAFLVGLSRAEIGVRLALGASPRSVKLRTIGSGLRWTLAGVALGIPASLAVSDLLSGQLHGVQPSDPVTLATVSALLVAVSIGAAWAPARRAARLDPAAVLREE